MPVSVVCDNVNAAIRDSIANSSSNSTSCGGLAGQNDDQQSLQSKLVASAKRVLLTKVEYEEVSNYNSSFLDNLKSKYMILKPSPPIVGKPSQNVQGDKEANQNSSSASPSSNATSYNTKDAHLPNPKKILFPRENVQIGWRSSGRKWNVGAGMVNVGNTCYLNSTLQALFHVPAVANWLVSDHAHRDKCEDENGTQGGCIICAMSKTLLHSQQSQCPIRPHLVYTKLRMVCKHLIMGRQEDAHEFLRYLVEAMEKSYLARFRNSKELDQFSKETTPLNQILGGYLRSAVRCLACGHISTTFQHFEDLLLDIRKANTLDEALEGYFARERLEDMGYKCESCKKKVAATKQFSLERAPISLCIQLKRFSMIGAKLNKHVGIRTRLDLTPYATKKNSEPLIYRLVSMVTHIGSSQHCGHYTAIGLTESGTYYHFDDSSVRAYAIQNVLNTSAYIIFYELEDSQQRSRQTSTITSREYYEQLKDAGKMNGVTENNDISRQYSSPSTSNSNPMHSLNAKVLSKLETTTPGAFIGPQLPDKNSPAYKENSDSHSTITNSNTQSTINGDVSKPKPGRYYLNNALSKIVSSVNKQVLPNDSSVVSNGTNGATSNNTHAQVTSTTSPSSSTTSQKPNQNIVDKLLNHLKAGNTPASNDNANSSNNSNKINGTNHESNDFLPKKSNTNDLNQNTKTESPVKNGDSSTHNGSNNNKTFSHKPDSPVLKDKTTKDRRSETPTKSNGNCLNTSTSSTINSNSMNSSFAETSKSSIRSLVPYETDDEENDDVEDMGASDDSDAGASSASKKQNRKNCIAIKRNNKVSNHNYNSDNESSSSFESYSSISRKKLTTPSPPVVESKTGYWQVETISTPNKSLLTSSSATATPTPDKDKKNPFHSTPSTTAISPDNFYSSSSPMKHKEKNKQINYKLNGSNSNHHLNGDNEVVNELSKLSHRGYGAPVLSWNGHKSNMDKEVNEEKRLERKRELVEDEENEMDRGKQKRIKIHGPAGRDNPGYNPFQDYQSQYQNSNNRRWNNGHSNNGRYHNGHVYRQNPHHNHHNHHHHHHHNNRNHNNFRRQRFHQRPHHQRNGDSNSYHRRDS